MEKEKKPQAGAEKAKGADAKADAASAAASPGDALKKKKQDKVSIDPAQRGKGGFDRSQLKGKAPIFRTMKKSGR
ncbi:MAG: hypothetical protein ABI036_02030 [Fibrobacteria bacterium]